MPYPDYRHYTNRDYGNRVGIFRLLELIDRYGLRASVMLNAAIVRRYPSLVRELVNRNIELVAHGVDMAHLHHGGLAREEEAGWVRSALDSIQAGSGNPVSGWLSPGRAQSWHTLDILAENGIKYCCDWANDDMPYVVRAGERTLLSMPLAHESEDRVVLQDLRHTEDQWLQQVKDQFDWLYREADRHGGRIMSLPLHAWIMGVPYRSTYVREALEYILERDGVWVATGEQIAAEFLRQAG